MTWILVGYLAKRRTTRAGWVSPWPEYPDVGFPCGPPVEEICSVSTCIARAGGDDFWTRNAFGLHADAGQAWGAIPAGDRAGFALYAYRLLSVRFEDGCEEAIDPEDQPEVEPIADSFVRLGWDAVEGVSGHGFGCSPLSCNSGADVVRCPDINRHCLVAEEQAAIALARSFSITKPEPGPYCVVEVWRDSAPPAGDRAAVEGTDG